MNSPLRRTIERRTAIIFLAAGVLLLLQVVAIGLPRYTDVSFSPMLAAPPGIAALVAAVLGLIGLYPRVANLTPRLAGAGAGAAAVAGLTLLAAGVWLTGVGFLGGGVPDPLPDWFGALVAVFLVTLVLGFALTAAACLRTRSPSRTVGYLLSVPVVSWGLLVAVAVATDLNAALSLDLYTNAVVAIALLGVGYSLRAERPSGT